MTGHRIMTRRLIELIGGVKLADLKARDADFTRGQVAERLSTRSVRLARMILIQAVRNAVVNDLVARNAAGLAAVPAGKPGRRLGRSDWSRLLPYRTIVETKRGPV